jgi:hypothetical protein
MKRSLAISALVAGLGLVGGWAVASDQTVLGKSFIVKNPSSADKRKVTSSAKELNSANTITGDPTLSGSAGGAILTIIANGASPSTQTFNLPQGTSVSGKFFWKASGTSGFKYKDGKGEQGPVKTVIIKKNLSGVFTIKAVIRGKNGALNVVPPDPGTDGFVTLKIGGGGDRYCLQFADGQVKNVDASLFKVRRPTTEGCPSSPSGAFLD